jgi:hypothetical protein
MIKRVLTALISLIVLSFYPTAVFAQGTCQFQTTPGHGGVPTQRTVTNNCDSGYSPTAVVKDSNPLKKADDNSAVAVCQCLTPAQVQAATANQTLTKGLGTPSPCIQTDLGCIPTDPAGLANAIFKIVLGVAGGLGILLVIMGGFKVATSQGNPDALEDGRDTITKAILGLAFILLATVILSIIGIDILGLDSFFQRSGGGIIFTP